MVVVPEVTNAPPTRRGRPTLARAAELDAVVRERALELFLAHGFEATTMNAIAAAAGTTKVALYSRYPSKDALFAAVFDWATHCTDWPYPEPPAPNFDDLEGALTAIARAALRRALDPRMVQLGRIAMAEAVRFPEIASRAYGAPTWSRRDQVVTLLAHHAERGEIVADDPDALAEHFLSMVSMAPARRAAFGVVRPADEQERMLQSAVQLFLRALRADA